jgi:hypothetical protein
MFPVRVWLFGSVSLVLALAGLESGRRLGLARRRQSAYEQENSVSAMFGCVLVLQAIMLAFRLYLAALQFEARRQPVATKASAIRAACLRTRFLPEPRRSPAALFLAVALAGVLFLFMDLDRARDGFMKASQEPLIDLHKPMLRDAPGRSYFVGPRRSNGSHIAGNHGCPSLSFALPGQHARLAQ